MSPLSSRPLSPSPLYLLGALLSVLLPLLCGCTPANTKGPRPQPSGLKANLPLDKRASLVLGDSTPFHMFVTLSVPATAESHFIYLANLAQTATRLEPGNLSYTFFRDAEQSGRYYIFETWASVPELTAHLAQPYTKELLNFAATSKAIVTASMLRPLAPGDNNLDQLPALLPLPSSTPAAAQPPAPVPATEVAPTQSLPATPSEPISQPPAVVPVPPPAQTLPPPSPVTPPPKSPPRVVRPRP